MFFVYYFAVIRVVERRSAELTYYLLFDFFHEFIFDFFVAEDIVWRDAGLAAVEIFAENYALGGEREFCRVVYYAGAFAAQFQYGRGEMFRRFAHDFFANALAAGEKYHVEFFVEQGGVLTPSACYYGDVFLVETLFHDFSDYFARSG